VATYGDAQCRQISILWEGANEQIFNRKLMALEDAGIPFTSELRTGPDQIGSVLLAVSLRAIFWRLGLFKNYAEKQKGWRIKVFQSDYSRAKNAVGDSHENPDPEMN
jgi:hypothetical protein